MTSYCPLTGGGDRGVYSKVSLGKQSLLQVGENGSLLGQCHLKERPPIGQNLLAVNWQ